MKKYDTWIIKDGNFSYQKVTVVDEDPDYWYTEDRSSYSKREYKCFSSEALAKEESNRRQTGGN